MQPNPHVVINLIGFFSLSLLQMAGLATPLWGNHLGLAIPMIGLAAGARSFLPLVYSMHFGKLMDVIGVRRFLIVFSALCAALPVLYPLLPFGWAFVLLQALLGFAAAIVWLAAQTGIARIAAGDVRRTGQFSFFTSVGTVIGPLLFGGAWDFAGPSGGFGLLALWGLCLFAASLMLPIRKDVIRPPLRFGSVIPRQSSFRDGLAMLERPVVLFVMTVTFLRLGSFSLIESFYPILLQDIGFSASAIAMLFAIGNLASSPSSLLAGWWSHVCGSSRRALSAGVALAIFGMAAIPFLGHFWQFACASAIFGFGMGVSMPLIFTLLSSGIEPDRQGIVAGLRATANRLAAFAVPPVMGLIAQAVGVGNAFLFIGLMLMAMLAVNEGYFRLRI